ncbi:MAG TPA: nickel ABC transporter permease [Gemmatimonadaceae bacterium]|nr:nickel ABC transporter permease [Gemmatimonadaceae bacterium]
MRPGIADLIGARVVSVLPVLLGVSILSFAIANLAPGDPAAIILQRQMGEAPTAVEVEEFRSRLGLDDPFPQRYGRWMGAALQGDLGLSYVSGRPVFETLVTDLPATLRLTTAGLLIGIAIALPLGVLAAVRRGSLLDHASRLLALCGASLPTFVVGYALILVFAIVLGWLPVAGSGDVAHFILPALTLGLLEAAALTRLTRAGMLSVLFEDYVRSARAKGLSGFRVVVRHALRNALNPLVTLAGIRFGRLMGGAVIIETLFARPGLGRAIVDAIFDRDYPTIQGFILFTGTLFVVVNLLVDISYVWLDPRVRLTAEQRANA